MSVLQDIALSRRPMSVLFAIGVIWGSYSALVPPVKAGIGASDALYGQLMLIASFGALSAMFLAPKLLSLIGPRAVALAACAMFAGFWLVGLAGSALLFCMIMVLTTAGTGVADVLANAEISEIEARSNRELMNLNHGIYSLAFALGAICTGLMRDAGLSAPVILSLYFALGCSLCALIYLFPSALKRQDEQEARSAPVPWGVILLGGGVVLAAFFSEAATEGWSALHLERTLGATAAQGGIGLAIFASAMAAGRFLGHVVQRKVPAILLLGMACTVAGLGLILVGLAPTVYVAFLGFGLAGLGVSVVVPLALSLVGRAVEPDVRVMAISRATAMGYAAFFFGPSLMGWVSEYFGLRNSFLMVSAVLICVGLFVIRAIMRVFR